MSFFCVPDEETNSGSLGISDGPGFNFFSCPAENENEGSDKNDIFDAMFPSTNTDNTTERSESPFFCGSTPKSTNNDRPYNRTADKGKGIKAMTGMREMPKDSQALRAQQSSALSASKHGQAESGGGEAKRLKVSAHNEHAPLELPTPRPLSAPAQPLPHPIRLLNELSPTNTSFKIPLTKPERMSSGQHSEFKETIAQSTSIDASNVPYVILPTSTSSSTTGPAPLRSQPSLSDKVMSAMNAPCQQSGSSPTSMKDTEVLSKALMSAQYETLRDQLSSLPTAKLSGDFVYQVAASVDVLFKCSEAEKDKQLTTMNNNRVNTLEKMGVMYELLNTQVKEVNDHHQAIVDHKLSQLSSILDEIKTNQEELAKYKQLLRSFSVDITEDGLVQK